MATTIDGTTSVTVPGTGSVVLTGATSGTITLTPTAVAGTTTLTMPATTGTLALTSEAVRQVVFTASTGYASGTTVMPWDNTIPQNTEGDQFMSVTITPKSSTSKLRITALGYFWSLGTNVISGAIFQDTTANALASGYTYFQANQGSILSVVYYMTSGTTSSTTFKFRAGQNGSGTSYFNGSSTAGLFNATCQSFMMVEEIGT